MIRKLFIASVLLCVLAIASTAQRRIQSAKSKYPRGVKSRLIAPRSGLDCVGLYLTKAVRPSDQVLLIDAYVRLISDKIENPDQISINNLHVFSLPCAISRARRGSSFWLVMSDIYTSEEIKLTDDREENKRLVILALEGLRQWWPTSVIRNRAYTAKELE